MSVIKNKSIEYFYFISNGVFHIYKFSARGRIKLKLIHAGLAFNKYGNYSNSFLKYQTKYELTSSGIETTSQNELDFFYRIYLSTLTLSVELHPIILNSIKFHVDRFDEENTKRVDRSLKRILKDTSENNIKRILENIYDNNYNI